MFFLHPCITELNIFPIFEKKSKHSHQAFKTWEPAPRESRQLQEEKILWQDFTHVIQWSRQAVINNTKYPPLVSSLRTSNLLFWLCILNYPALFRNITMEKKQSGIFGIIDHSLSWSLNYVGEILSDNFFFLYSMWFSRCRFSSCECFDFFSKVGRIFCSVINGYKQKRQWF